MNTFEVKYKCPWQCCNYRKCFGGKKHSLEQGLCKTRRKSTESFQNMKRGVQGLGKEIELGARGRVCYRGAGGESRCGKDWDQMMKGLD